MRHSNKFRRRKIEEWKAFWVKTFADIDPEAVASTIREKNLIGIDDLVDAKNLPIMQGIVNFALAVAQVTMEMVMARQKARIESMMLQLQGLGVVRDELRPLEGESIRESGLTDRALDAFLRLHGRTARTAGAHLS